MKWQYPCNAWLLPFIISSMFILSATSVALGQHTILLRYGAQQENVLHPGLGDGYYVYNPGAFLNCPSRTPPKGNRTPYKGGLYYDLQLEANSHVERLSNSTNKEIEARVAFDQFRANAKSFSEHVKHKEKQEASIVLSLLFSQETAIEKIPTEYDFADSLRDAAAKLTKDASENARNQFISNWGTHYVEQIIYGKTLCITIHFQIVDSSDIESVVRDLKADLGWGASNVSIDSLSSTRLRRVSQHCNVHAAVTSWGFDSRVVPEANLTSLKTVIDYLSAVSATLRDSTPNLNDAAPIQAMLKPWAGSGAWNSLKWNKLVPDDRLKYLNEIYEAAMSCDWTYRKSKAGSECSLITESDRKKLQVLTDIMGRKRIELRKAAMDILSHDPSPLASASSDIYRVMVTSQEKASIETLGLEVVPKGSQFETTVPTLSNSTVKWPVREDGKLPTSVILVWSGAEVTYFLRHPAGGMSNAQCTLSATTGENTTNLAPDSAPVPVDKVAKGSSWPGIRFAEIRCNEDQPLMIHCKVIWTNEGKNVVDGDGPFIDGKKGPTVKQWSRDDLRTILNTQRDSKRVLDHRFIVDVSDKPGSLSLFMTMTFTYRFVEALPY